ncbi:tyrosinase family protein [Formosa sp. S-31]|uniref:tyrosinase family protein n=1 Tax=Formosa sp. S-31 TaxID=2790949 RepID=UPI003EBBA7E6
MKSIRWLLVVGILVCCKDYYAQSIRKNYQEMTAYERDELVDAFYAMRSGADLMNDLADFHGDFFNFDGTSDPTRLDIHFNLPDEPERQIFFPWHRRQMFELEQAMQDVNPDVSLPWWDSSVDQSINSPLWDQNFMGQFDAAWELERNYATVNNVSLLPTPADVQNVQAIQDFLLYSDVMERGRVHTGAHRWTGGAMPTPVSPRDPIFYLHHTFVDKLWDDWETANPGGSSHIITSMLRYDGTYRFNGQLLPLVDPDDIVNSRALGVFYAENQLAQLTNYTVSNTYHNLENFYYQYLINVGNNFIVPDGRNCVVKSVSAINLLPGFLAEEGSLFVAEIDAANMESKVNNVGVLATRLNSRNPYDYNPHILNKEAYNPKKPKRDKESVSLAPNPFENRMVFVLQEDKAVLNEEYKVRIFDASGRLVLERLFVSENGKFEISNLSYLKKGVYVIEVFDSKGEIFKDKIIKQ